MAEGLAKGNIRGKKRDNDIKYMITGGGDLAARREAAASWEFSPLFLTYKTHPSLLTNSSKSITSY